VSFLEWYILKISILMQSLKSNYYRNVDTFGNVLKIKVSRNSVDWVIFSDLIDVPDNEVQELLDFCDEVEIID